MSTGTGSDRSTNPLSDKLQLVVRVLEMFRLTVSFFLFLRATG